ncbi:hypothetical protein [Limisalsivibrio acetivorans]|uniref:hypothetical protein n=1 Tax=Limisalsivibrio acetivorans TaxID=1304888 RepID=UPI0003B3DFB1|nr:hypothetical protein [Limisalsivibrio acetivorans]
MRTILKYAFMYTFAVMITSAFLTAGPQKAYADNHYDDKIEQKYEALKEYSETHKGEAVETARELREDIDRRIDTLENRADEEWDNMSSDAKTKYRKQMRQLRHQQNEISEWIGELKHSTGEAWEDVKGSIADSYEDTKEYAEDVADNF